MALAIGLLILAAILFGVGFAVKVLWYVAIVILVVALVSFVMGRRRL
ncbi:MAG: hydrophobic protein [Candidatus Dormibacteria bacterium]